MRLIAVFCLVLVVLSAPVYAASCNPGKHTNIKVTPKTKDIKYNTEKTLAQMQNMQSDTVNPYGFHAVTRTQGMMEGAIKITQIIELGHKEDRRRGGVCIWYDSINIEIEIDPTIYIAREIYADKCMGRAVLEHEMEHIKIDRKIVNEFATLLGQRLYDGLKQRGFSNIVPYQNAQDTGTRMQQTVNQIVDHEYKRMEFERLDRQRAFDSHEEYERVAAMCPNFKLPQG